MDSAPRGTPLDTDFLRTLGVDPSATTRMIKAGWLHRLSKGAYLLRGDSPSRDGLIAYLSRQIVGLHVGGKTALDWQGIRHNIAFRPRIVLWGATPYRFPTWVAQYMSYTYQTTRLFGDWNAPSAYLKPLPFGDSRVLVSIPELAFLELVSAIGRDGIKGQSMEEALNIADGLRNLRSELLAEMLERCTSVKVVKLARDLGVSSGHAWGRDLQTFVDRKGANRRWTRRLKDGTRLTLKP
ncbi:conserved hypothetical protein [Paraburkholderia phymatum STM815]|uniref:Transcriptional regulator AbiEi antitoxin N-terminal domain-containing protein n=2 Tax=Paraburkholderia phymatum TaxID=148447 RepID=B2JC80_PARP8|nr:conserved hypothetical protein [Paraburkholderia phymatum STM815]